MSNIQIILNTRVDSPDVEAAIVATEPLIVEVVNGYINGTDVDEIDLTAVSSTLKDQIVATIDSATFIEEEDALIWKITKSGKTFNLESSYVRDAEDTTGTLTALTTGTPIMLRAEIPGFSENTVREITLWYDAEFLTSDKNLLKEIGVNINGNGSEFEIINSVDCKLSFRKPDLASEVYVIVFPTANEVIPME